MRRVQGEELRKLVIIIMEFNKVEYLRISERKEILKR